MIAESDMPGRGGSWGRGDNGEEEEKTSDIYNDRWPPVGRTDEISPTVTRVAENRKAPPTTTKNSEKTINEEDYRGNEHESTDHSSLNPQHHHQMNSRSSGQSSLAADDNMGSKGNNGALSSPTSASVLESGYKRSHRKVLLHEEHEGGGLQEVSEEAVNRSYSLGHSTNSPSTMDSGAVGGGGNHSLYDVLVNNNRNSFRELASDQLAIMVQQQQQPVTDFAHSIVSTVSSSSLPISFSYQPPPVLPQLSSSPSSAASFAHNVTISLFRAMTAAADSGDGTVLMGGSTTTTVATRLVAATTPGNASSASWSAMSKVQIPLYAVIFLLAVIGNSLVILTLVQNKRMRTITNVFLLNLAISDLFLGVLCMPFTLVGTLKRDFVFGAFMCKILPFLQGKDDPLEL